MKKIVSPRWLRWLCALLITASASRIQAQERPMKIVYDENNHPYIEREIIVRFAPSVLIYRNIDRPSTQSGHLNDFISAQALESISSKLGYNAAAIDVFKIFAAMTSADTLSVDRTGKTIRSDDHWASLVLQLAPGKSEQQASIALNELFPSVRYAHLNWVYELQITGKPTGKPNDSFYLTQQASLHATVQYPNGHINAQNAWLYQTGRNHVRVGVFDTGIDAAHPDLGNGSIYSSIVTMGRDYLTNNSRYFIQDTNGHGTAVAGIIAAKRNDGVGIAGIAGGDYGIYPTQSGVQLVDLKIGNGSITTSAAISAIVEGATFSSAASGYGFGLQVMNHSWGGPQGSDALKDAVRTAYRNGCVFVASRGNGPPQSASATAANYPASYDDSWVVSVGASGTDGQHKTASNGNRNHPIFNDAYESSYGGGVDLIAPGTTDLVYTTRSQVGSWGSGSYTDFNGTSAAAPHVSGVAALVLSNQNDPNNPLNNLTGEDVQRLLKRTANDRVQSGTAAVPGYDDLTGWGLLDAGKAVFQSRPAIYRFVHTNVTNPSNVASLDRANSWISLPSNYVGNGASLTTGNYRADVWKVSTAIPARNPSGPITSNDQILDVWPRNSTSTLWGPANPLIFEPGIRVTSWDQNSAIAEGYTYHILTDVLGRTIDKWIPVNLANSRLDVTFYTYNRTLDLRSGPDGYTTQRSVAGFPSTAYPNPASSELSLTFENPPTEGALTLEIMTSTGMSVRHQPFSASSLDGRRVLQLSIGELAAGLYTYRLITNQGVSVGKFIKQ